MNAPTLTCQDDRRRDLVRDSSFFGLDYLEVSPDQLTLTVVFLGRAPQNLTPANLRIQGGERITDIQVTGLTLQPADDPALDDSMLVTVNQPGDFSPYRLCVQALDDQGRPTGAPFAGFDSRYACLEFTFKAGCPSDLDCHPPLVCPPTKRTEPEINYLAKDYASFRQLILDRLAVIMPGWQERHVPDLGVTLVEVLAYVGDYLSYYQDAVATEAYLATARQRISVRRHVRLIDYPMHEGCNARAWVCLQLNSLPKFDLIPSEVLFIAGLDQTAAFANKNILTQDELNAAPAGTYDVFEPLVAEPTVPFTLYAAHNRISFYTWGDQQCCLPTGATRAVLLDTWAGPNQTDGTAPRGLSLQPGDVLLFEEVKGPVTGNPADADPARRWAVRLIQVTPTTDPLIETADGRPTPLVEIEWAAADALPLPFCLSARLPAPDCRIIGDISVAWGNVILVDHGQTLRPCEILGTVEKLGQTGNCACEGSVIEMTSVPGVFRPVLQQSPLTFGEPLPPNRPASKTLVQDPRAASPAVVLHSLPPAPDGTAPLFPPEAGQNLPALAGALKADSTPWAKLLFPLLSVGTRSDLAKWDGTSPPPPALLAEITEDLTETWRPQRDLLESGPADSQFVVEMDDNGLAHLRFGDGVCGRQPAAGMAFLACYRIGNGTPGNVGADRITQIAFRNKTVEGLSLTLRNPLPALGGTDPEPVTEVKLFAPGAFQKVLERAITAADYAAIAERNPKLQQANAALRWTGSWYEARVAVDPLGGENPDDTLLRHVAGYLHRFRRLGHDLEVDAARYVPLKIAMTVCVLPQYLRGHVEAALLDVFSSGVRANGQPGFFHPDNLTFGEGVYRSTIIATAQAVPGVKSVEVTTFQRLFAPASHEPGPAVLPLGPMEIAQLDNDPSFPEHGTFTLNLRGGR